MDTGTFIKEGDDKKPAIPFGNEFNMNAEDVDQVLEKQLNG